MLINIKEDTSSSVNDPSADSRKGEVSASAEKSYDQLLRKLEEEARDHIRIEQQLKLYIDSMEEQIDESEKEINLLKSELKGKIGEINVLKENAKEADSKCQELKQRVEMLERNASPAKETFDQSHTQLTVSAEKKPARASTEFAKSKRMMNMSKKVLIVDC
eukprot:TRINITY_DN13116_c0_g2_i3.p1 TRINITY_DN13116_c0_g2~~TRINITY_DN13116_c0_g2_i3.p1  ORF type:complete len:162 (+),score=65.52 TRINITY_DN13116_c0_g2_i3:280-765(+)